jgi:hypothetical protein
VRVGLEENGGMNTRSLARDRAFELALLSAVVLLGVVGAIFAALAWRTANEALEQTKVDSWAYTGAQWCHDYRSEVLDLAAHEVPVRQIRAWFVVEAGGAQNEFRPGGNETALGDMEESCGSVADLVKIWRPNARPSSGVMSRLANP